MSQVQDRNLTLEDLIEYNMTVPFDQRRVLLYGIPSTGMKVCTLADELPSFLIGGLPGHGKTTAMAWIACQLVMALGKLIVIDPHINAPRDSLAKLIAPLSEWYAVPTIDFEDSSQVVKVFRFVLQEYNRRNTKYATNFYPLFVLIDEWNLLLDSLDDDEYDEVIKVVRTIGRSARKFGIWLGLIAQNWNLDASGGSDVRKAITGRFCFAAEMADMRTALNTRESSRLTDLCATPLGKGDCIFKHPADGLIRVKFSPMDAAECQAVADAMHDVLGYSAPAVGTDSGQNRPQNRRVGLPDTDDTPPPLIKPTHVESAIPLSPHSVVPTVPTVSPIVITEEERILIIREATKQLQETGKVVRLQIKKALAWNSDQYAKIKIVCDEMNFHKDMQPVKLSTEQKQALRSAAGKCARCGSTEDLEIDHIFPRSLGGPTTTDNLQILCATCNKRKGIHTN